MQRTLRVLTLNCWNVSEPFEDRMRLIRSGLDALQPDVIGLQEIVVRRDGFDQAAQILNDCGYQWTYGAAFRFTERQPLLAPDQEGDGFGNLVASRWPILRSAARALPGIESGERRNAVAALVDAPCGPIVVVSTHLNWKFHHGHIRERQAVALAAFVEEWAVGSERPAIVVGDLNADPDSAEIRFLCGLQSLEGRSAYFQDAWRVAGKGGPGWTWDNRNRFAAYAFEPDRRIDYILVGLADSHGRGWIESVRVVMDQAHGAKGAEVFPSDHFGVLADIRM
jgi:endonuclease/exonuclease/phosphatase family metal-dependent hydrolase